MSALESRQNAAQAASSRESHGSGTAPTPPPDTSISTSVLTRILIALIAVWSLLAGLTLVFFQGTGSGALGAGVADVAGQRLLGAHFLVLAPVYILIAWRSQNYQGLFWFPFLAQLAVFFAIGYAILNGDTDFGDGVLPVTISAIFIALLSFVWITEQRGLARMRLDEEESAIDRQDQESAVDEPGDDPD